ncbi:helix-turn-helix domain-containing protein [Epilithonimonas sp. JDS]|uniref:helix-turn-helix domain-containing protein n=1 Tax=Epilithonimonas sp. JDS TaxID=2902797 RepID=UPI001E563FFF|nr:helix-turn-helix domain-containing protein [Epilithonimonas sp. JDS]MCD9855737.1 helix-turn-helix domain-containing protein [Epilithonimonas sp. JDS]
MAKFTKDISKKVPEEKVQVEVNIEDILSPLYFPPPEDQMRQKEVAEMFSTTVQTIINWSTAGKIPTFRVGKVPIYSRKLLIYIARNNRNLLKS